MTFDLPNLDDDHRTRQYMSDELNSDQGNNRVFLSKRQTPAGHRAWPDLLRDALASHNPAWLTSAVSSRDYWLTDEPRVRNGKTTWAKVPVTAAATLAEGEFIRYYLRGVSRRAIEDGARLEVTRLKYVEKPRSASAALIGTFVDPQSLLEDLRQNIGIDTILGIPQGPNSGLGVKIA